MENPDPYKNWLEEFHREVDETLAQGQGAAPQAPSVERTLNDFQNWWAQETGDPQKEPEPSFMTEQSSKELALSRDEVRLLKAQLESQQEPAAQAGGGLEAALRKQEDERQALKGRISQLEADNLALQRQHDEVQRQAAELRIALTKAQESHADQIRRMEEKLRHLGEQLRLLGEDRQFLQNDHARQAAKLEDQEAERRAAAADLARLETEKMELQRRVSQLESSAVEADTRRAVLEATINEVRMQAGDLQERFIRSQRTAITELEAERRKASAAAETAPAEKERLEAEGRLRETTRYLELKLREVQDENKGRLEEFREMLEAVSRLGAKQ